METTSARARRKREGFFEKYIAHPGIDVGCGYDPVDLDFARWDQAHYNSGDATFMVGVPDGAYNTVYSSHLLEHVHDPVTALQNWYRILAPGGHLIVCVPHRDLYEKKPTLPSLWNLDHKTFWLPETAEEPDTRSLKGTVLEAIPGADIVSLRVLDGGWVPRPVEQHSCGEYSIEVIVRKPHEQLQPVPGA